MKLALGACALLMAMSTVVGSASAHHSFAMFDQTKQVTLNGTVKEFQWTNPHSWIQLTVSDTKGTPQTWAIEALSPNVLSRMGWKKNSLKPGDKVVVVINPVKNGANGGNLISVTNAAGVRIGGPPQ